MSKRNPAILSLLTLALLLASARAQDTAACEAKAAQEKSPQFYEIAKAVFDVRQLIYNQKSDEALTAAKALQQKYPADSNVQAALGEAFYRHGELSPAASAINQAVQLDACNARAHYDAWEFFSLTGMHRTALQQLTMAHNLDNQDTVIDWAWRITERQAKDPESSRCHLASSATSATLSIDPRGNNTAFTTGAMLSAKVNGKSFHLIVDTGDPGITLTEDEAKQAGIIPERTFKSSAHGATGDGSVSGFASHIKTLQLGPITLENCPVSVVTDSPVNSGGIGLKLLRTSSLPSTSSALASSSARCRRSPLRAPPARAIVSSLPP